MWFNANGVSPFSTYRNRRRGRPPPPFLASFGFSAIRASLVKSSVATLAAFCRAVRVTLVGSMTPALTRSSYTSVAAL